MEQAITSQGKATCFFVNAGYFVLTTKGMVVEERTLPRVLCTGWELLKRRKAAL